MNARQVQKSLKAVNSLIRDLEACAYIPPKFRRAPFTDELRAGYVADLVRERARLEKLLQPPPTKPVVEVVSK